MAPGYLFVVVHRSIEFVINTSIGLVINASIGLANWFENAP